MLVNIYDWFTESFDTADLKDAKAQRSVASRGTSAEQTGNAGRAT
jgi:hypothetical protein